MLPYTVVMSLALACALIGIASDRQNDPLNIVWVRALWLVLLTGFVGARFEVGGDWDAYSRFFHQLKGADVGSVLRWDPAYGALNWIGANVFGSSVVFVNSVCAAFLSAGVIGFCRILPNPSLALQLTLPYLVIVVGMGFTRQATAIGLIMWALASANESRTANSIILMVLAATFHKAAALLVPLLLWFGNTASKVSKGIILLVAATVAGALLLPTAGYSIGRYLFEDWASQGALIRALFNFSAAIVFLRFSEQLTFSDAHNNLFRAFSYAAIGFSLLLVLSPTSAIVDRMGLFLLPFQIAIFSTLPVLFAGRSFRRRLAEISLVVFAWAQFLGWFQLSPYASSWLPYRNVMAL